MDKKWQTKEAEKTMNAKELAAKKFIERIELFQRQLERTKEYFAKHHEVIDFELERGSLIAEINMIARVEMNNLIKAIQNGTDVSKLDIINHFAN